MDWRLCRRYYFGRHLRTRRPCRGDMERLGPVGRLYAMDMDPGAGRIEPERFGRDAPSHIRRGTFAMLAMARERVWRARERIMLDWACLSPQLDDARAASAFSWTAARHALGSRQLLRARRSGWNRADVAEIVRVLQEYGEERSHAARRGQSCRRAVNAPSSPRSKFAEIIAHGGGRRGSAHKEPGSAVSRPCVSR